MTDTASSVSLNKYRARTGSYTGYNRPVANRHTTKRGEEKSYKTHKWKIANVEPMIDTSPPACFNAMHQVVKLNTMQYDLERKARIQKENRMLLERMWMVMSRDNHTKPNPTKQPSSYRRQDFITSVARENSLIMQRLMCVRPMIDRNEFIEHAKKHDADLEYISRFPPPNFTSRKPRWPTAKQVLKEASNLQGTPSRIGDFRSIVSTPKTGTSTISVEPDAKTMITMSLKSRSKQRLAESTKIIPKTDKPNAITYSPIEIINALSRLQPKFDDTFVKHPKKSMDLLKSSNISLRPGTVSTKVSAKSPTRASVVFSLPSALAKHSSVPFRTNRSVHPSFLGGSSYSTKPSFLTNTSRNAKAYPSFSGGSSYSTKASFLTNTSRNAKTTAKQAKRGRKTSTASRKGKNRVVEPKPSAEEKVLSPRRNILPIIEEMATTAQESGKT